jgi:alkanesulfonate monooxygenase SsuD/methylene tetrahydromethanopterin reductase-like flavin-dependent oxidoreductase (luciferase family)
VPIIIGGDSKIAARRAGRLGDGYFQARGAPQELFDLVRSTAEEHDRDPGAIEFTAALPQDLDDIPKLAAQGISRLVVPVSNVTGLDTVISSPDDALGWADTIEKYADV